MSQKFNITYDSPTIITINGKWKQNSYLHVTYSWSGEPDSVTLPVDNNDYIPENTVSVDRTYVANQIVDDYKGTMYYQFSGWDKSDFNITADTTITGTWTSIPYSFVKYDWDNPLVTNTLPVDNTYYHQNDLVTVDDRASGSIKLYDKWAESNEMMKMTNGPSNNCVCYSEDLDRFVCVFSETKEALYSNDGITWNASTISSTERNWYSVCYGNGKFVAVANNTSYFAYSNDGITWTEGTISNTKRNWYSVCYGNGKFIAVAYNSNYFAYSNDGITWTEGTISNTSRNWYSVCYGNGKFVAVASSTNYFAYSNDGINWTESTISDTNREWYSVCYGNDKFVATTKNDGYTAYSNDGITWTESKISQVNIGSWYSVCYGNGKFVAVGYSGLVYSTDGITWTEGDMPNSKAWYSVCYGNGKFVAISIADTNAMSTDGINWTEYHNLSFYEWISVCYGNDMYVAIASNSQMFAFSFDGINWIEGMISNTKREWQSVCYGNGKFVAVAYNSKYFVYSNDGMTWTESTMPNSRQWYSVCYGNGKFVAVAYNSNYFAYSNDGITWTEGDMPNSRYWRSVCYGNGKFIAVVYNSNYFAYSNDGMTWAESKVSNTNRYWTSVCYGNDKFVAVATNDKYFAYSNDGMVWTEGNMTTNQYCISVCYGNGKFVAVTRSKRVNKGCWFTYSNDGITWREAIVPNSNYFYSVCYGNGKFVAVAEYMSIHYYLDHINYTEFSAWDHTNFNITEDTTIKALWETKNKLKVEYSWSGAPSSLTSVPPDTSYYMPNTNVTVDSYYDENCVCTSDSGCYQFSGWDKENFNITSDTSISGTWSLISTPAINTGDTFLFGKYQVESEDPWAIEWEIVDDTNSDYIIAQTKSIIDLRAFDGKEPNNTDSDRQYYGNNNWQYSNIKQFLNSDSESWYSAQHQYDAPPNSDNVYNNYNPYDTHKGFLYYFTNEEKSFLQDMTLTLAKPTIDGGGSYTWTGKVWLPTYTQMSGNANNNINEGTLFNKYSDNNSRIKYIHEKCAENNQYCIDNGYSSTTAQYYWISSANPSDSGYVRRVNNVGVPGNNRFAYNGNTGLAPCIKMKRSDLTRIILAKDHKIIN